MGTLRFLLSILVLVSHNAITIGGLHLGVMAVIAFYVISGYVMSALIERHYPLAKQTGHFYADRILRIYPQYAVYALATVAWLFALGHNTAFLTRPATPIDALNNTLIVPLNYYMYNQADQFTLIPPAWSLGVEITFYAMAPFLWRHWRWAIALGVLSLGIQSLAWYGHLHSDWWGYRLMPGVLWIFVLGMALQRYAKSHPRQLNIAAATLPFLLGVVATGLAHTGHLTQPYHREVLLGLALSIPLIQWLVQHPPRQQRLQHLDAQLGNWSYGIFLNHFLLMWTFSHGPVQQAWALTLLVIGSIAISILTQRLAEQPLLHLRRQWLRLN